jgi:hypothetical protein
MLQYLTAVPLCRTLPAFHSVGALTIGGLCLRTPRLRKTGRLRPIDPSQLKVIKYHSGL